MTGMRTKRLLKCGPGEFPVAGDKESLNLPGDLPGDLRLWANCPQMHRQADQEVAAIFIGIQDM